MVDNKPILEQFIGLTDEDGKDIYEGDVWECGWDNSQIIKYNQNDGHYELVDSIHGDVSDFVAGYNNFGKIVGNIHENPELLETKWTTKE
jgi:hypothetical protein